MAEWLVWTAVAIVAWVVLSVPLALLAARFVRTGSRAVAPAHRDAGADATPRPATVRIRRALHILVVDDDPGLRLLLRTTFEAADIEVEEAASAAVASERIAGRAPDVVVLDVAMPGMDGLSFCRALKDDPERRHIGVLLLTGSEGASTTAAEAAGADAFLRKPFSPLAVLSVVERLASGASDAILVHARDERYGEDQLLLYADSVSRLLDLERGQRTLLQRAYSDTVLALARALESKDTGTGAHSQRVRSYAVELAREIEPALLDDPGAEHGFLLHDVGKIGIPDRVLRKHGALTPAERRLMQTHTVLGEQMLGDVAILQGEALRVVRHHHERWDGGGYPDRLGHEEIPLAARIFAVADSLDAMTSDRPYRPARPWDDATQEIVREAGRQFDPTVIDAFRASETRLRRIHYELRG